MSSYARAVLIFVFATVVCIASALAQTESATISGRVTDTSGAIVVGAEVEIQSIERGTSQQSKSNEAGIYSFPGVQPGQYHVTVRKTGFKTIELVGLSLNVQDHVEKNFQLQVGSVSESVTVSADDSHINTTDAAVSTVVDRQFAENLPLNGRSFQSLIDLTPGVVVTPSSFKEPGQFSVNGQRTGSNYWLVDGVSANAGTGQLNGNAPGGALPSFSALGGTNSLVSVDALQEFRIQTSTYAPEFGRVPGGQISILTRSGTNEFHGTLFEYLRNDALDANNWFSNFAHLSKSEERQNDFGGTVGGRIKKDRTFFFFSYEGLRLRLPQTVLSVVPDLAARQNALPAVQRFLNAFPLPNGSDNLATGIAQLNAGFSNAGSLDAASLRIDHKLGNRWNLFARYNYSPSEVVSRGGGEALSQVSPERIVVQTSTLGATTTISPVASNDLRFNFSRTVAATTFHLDDFMGAVPLTALPLPQGTSGNFAFGIFSLTNGDAIAVGSDGSQVQRQINIVDSVSIQAHSHSLKFGVDFRHLQPTSAFQPYNQSVFFGSVSSAETGSVLESAIINERSANLLFRNLGLFAQDTWRIAPRFTLTYGLRWDVDFAPSSTNGPDLPAVTGFDLQNLSNLALARPGTLPFETTYGNVAPRIGGAYEVSTRSGWETVLRAGFGVFYDLVTSEAGNLYNPGAYPFGREAINVGGTFPLSPSAAAPSPIIPPNAQQGFLLAFDPHIQLPYNLQWSVALEQALGTQQTLSATYIGSAGRRLLQTAQAIPPNPNFAEAFLTTDTATSDYEALQVQFERRLSHGLQALASYTWSHCSDQASSAQGAEADVISVLNSKSDRGPCAFDIRNTFSMGLTYEIPAPKLNKVANSILHGWALQNVVQARSAPPVDVSDNTHFAQLASSSFVFDLRPDVVPGQPLYLFGAQCVAGLGVPCPGGKGLNPAAFTDPPVDPVTGLPTRQGTLGRNALRGFGATQWDLAVHRDFPIHESMRLQFRAEMFNVLNHPNFGPPSGLLGQGGFGVSSQMLAQSLNSGFGGNVGNGAFSPLYQLGGPRSIQFGLKLRF